jgi:hypothetical protein
MPETFTPKIAPHLLKGLDEPTRWLYEQLDIQGQQNDHLILCQGEQIRFQQQINQRLADGEQRFAAIESALKDHDQVVSKLKSGRSVLFFLFTSLVIPVLVLIIAEQLLHPSTDSQHPKSRRQQTNEP